MTARNIILSVLSLLGLLISSCSPMETKVIYGEAASLAEYKTWRWFHSKALNSESTANDGFEKLIKQFVEQQMEQLGYTRVESEQNSDFFMDFRVSIMNTAVPGDGTIDQSYKNFDQDNIHDYGMQWNFGSGDGVSRGEWKDPESEYRFYRQGILFLGAFKEKASDEEPERLWVAKVQRLLKTEATASAEERDEILQQAVMELTKNLPRPD